MKTTADSVLEFRRDMIEQWLRLGRAGKDLTVAAINVGFEVWAQQARAQTALAQRFATTWMELCSSVSRRTS